LVNSDEMSGIEWFLERAGMVAAAFRKEGLVALLIGEHSMASERMDTIRCAIEEAWNKGNVDMLDQAYVPDCISHPVSPGGVQDRGVEAQKEYVRKLRAVFSDFCASIKDMFCAGDKVAFRWIVSGTQTREWLGIAPTGKHVTWGGITICRFVGNRIQEDWLAADMFGALATLGALSPTIRAGAAGVHSHLRLLGHRGKRFKELGGLHYVIEGEVENIADQGLDRVEVVVTMYDEDNVLLATQRSLLSIETLQPGEVSPFRVQVTEVGRPFTRYEIRFEREGHMVGVDNAPRNE